MTDFSNSFAGFSVKVHEQFNAMQKHTLFETINGNDLWITYLSAFPEGTNPLFRTNTEHDCSCCKQFIRNIGGVVALVDGKRMTVWDVKGLPHPYNVVAARLQILIQLAPITALYKAAEPSYGAVFSRETLEDGSIKRWNHFHAKVEARHQSKQIGKEQGEYAGAVQVFKRGLLEIPDSVVSDVKELIAENAIYRGSEHSPSIAAFLELKRNFAASSNKEEFIWEHAYKAGARIRNTAIGTLLVDLSEGKPLEEAVKAFEAKVAPMNYKRTTALVTPSMVKAAAKQIEALGLEESLDRRYAVIGDVTIGNVLFVDRGSKGKLRSSGAMGVLEAMGSVTRSPNVGALPMLMNEFLKEVLPSSESIEVLMKNDLQNNLVSLTAPVHLDPQDPSKLFNWNNDFGWSYNGNITDSNIKELVRKAGGNVTNAKLRMSLAWFNHDDLDLHVILPNGKHIYFANKAGILDVDMNAWTGQSRTPVENLSFTQVIDGDYDFYVNQFNPRDSSDKGFTLELESAGKLHHYQSAVSPGHRKDCHLRLEVKNGVVTRVIPQDGITGGQFSAEVWSIETEKFVKVNTVMLSPNHWDGQVIGNKHVFFMLEGCKNPESTRGIYNEFLKPSLQEHRKVFEMLGEKSKCAYSADQLSGVGFSSTKSDEVIVAVTSGGQRRQYSLSF